MKIKICGLKQPENIKAIAALKPDYMGFIFYDASPRYIADLPTDALTGIPANITKAGVFVNETSGIINQLVSVYHLDAVQLHGQESPEFCRQFKGEVTVIKAFGIDEHFDFSILEDYSADVDYFLFDAKTVMHGGSGQTFNWDILQKYRLDIPFFLSGGLSTDNLEEVVKISHPQFYGVDLNSRFETAPGIKNLKKIKNAFKILIKTGTHEIRS